MVSLVDETRHVVVTDVSPEDHGATCDWCPNGDLLAVAVVGDMAGGCNPAFLCLPHLVEILARDCVTPGKVTFESL